MLNVTKLLLLKILHTAIWIFYNLVVAYLLYAVVFGQIDVRVWVCLGLIGLEALILLVFKNICPVTIIARKYSASQKENFDIFLPNWLARYNKQIYTGIVFVIIVILILRLSF